VQNEKMESKEENIENLFSDAKEVEDTDRGMGV